MNHVDSDASFEQPLESESLKHQGFIISLKSEAIAVKLVRFCIGQGLIGNTLAKRQNSCLEFNQMARICITMLLL